KPTFKIADYDKSSCTWRGIRFYNSKADYRYTDIPFPIKYDKFGNTYYKLDLSTFGVNVLQNIINIFIMHTPNGFYINHDIYTMFYMLFMEESFYNYMKSN